MPPSQSWQSIRTHLSLEQFHEFVLPYLPIGSRDPQPKLPLHLIFNYILKFCTWAGNGNESPLLAQALHQLTDIAQQVGQKLKGSTISLDGVYDSRVNRKAIFDN